MPITHQCDVRISFKAEMFRHYQQFKGKTGKVESLSMSSAGEVATVLFELPEGTMEAHIPIKYLVAYAEAPTLEQKAARREEIAIPADEGDEAAKQGRAVKFLRNLGYRITVTGKNRQPATCPACTGSNHGRAVPVLCPIHKKPVFSHGAINNSGLGDILITHPERWGIPGRRRPQLEQEWKRDGKAPRKTGQIERAQEGTSAFVWSLDMCLADLVAFERQSGFEPHPEVLKHLSRQTSQDAAHV